jgi:hypothetical protein
MIRGLCFLRSVLTEGQNAKLGASGKPNSVIPTNRDGDHSSRRLVAKPLKRPTRSSNETGRLSLLIWACWRWGLPCRRGHPRSRCALTAPFHPYRPKHPDGGSRPAVYFLWHFPSAHAGSPLAITVPCPVRTFLPAVAGRAIASLTPVLIIADALHWAHRYAPKNHQLLTRPLAFARCAPSGTRSPR